MKIKIKTTLIVSLVIILSLVFTASAAFDTNEMCLKVSPIPSLFICEDVDDTLCIEDSKHSGSCDDVVVCTKSLTDYCEWSNLGSCLFTGNDANGNSFYEPVHSPNDNIYPGYNDSNKDNIVDTDSADSACELGCCIITAGESGEYYAFGGDSVPRVQCEDYEENGLSMEFGIEFVPGLCEDYVLDCFGVGEIIDLDEGEECCPGLNNFQYSPTIIDSTRMCYDPAIGEPECAENGTPEEGWYYDTTEDLIAIYNCDLGIYQEVCNDSDGGYNYYEYGYAEDDVDRIYDACEDSTYLKEAVCVSDTAVIFTYECPHGCDVNHGVCFEQKKYCGDTDFGTNYFTKGVVSNIDGEMCCEGLIRCEYNSTHDQCKLPGDCDTPVQGSFLTPTIKERNLITGNSIASITGMAPAGCNIVTTDITPTMTSDYAPSGIVTVSGSNTGGSNIYYAFDGINSNSRAWTGPLNQDNQWIQYDFGIGERKRVSGIKVSRRPSAGDGTKDFNIKGSNDGINWVTLYSGTFAQSEFTKELDLTSVSDYYRIYRYTGTSHYGNSLGNWYIDLAEMELYEDDCVEPWVPNCVIDKTDVVPVMTSDSAPSGVVSASDTAGSYYPWWAFDGRINNINAWIGPLNQDNHWVQYDFGLNNEKAILGFRLYRRPTAGDGTKEFTISASNDGSSWTNLYSGEFGQYEMVKEVELSSSQEYRMYRFTGTSHYGNSQGNWYIDFAEIEMYEGTCSNIGCDDNVLLIHSNDVDGSQNIVDSSNSNNNVMVGGNARHSTTRAKFGSSSIYFDGQGSYLDADVTGLSDGDDFTIDFWVYHDAVDRPGRHYLFEGDGGNHIYTDMTGHLTYNNGVMGINLVTSNGGFTNREWHHVAIVNDGSTAKLYVDGILESTDTSVSGAVVSEISELFSLIGTYSSSSSGYNFIGYMDEIRLSNVSRWDSDFTPENTYYCEDGPQLPGEIPVGTYIIDDSEDVWYCEEDYCTEISQDEITGQVSGSFKIRASSDGGAYVLDNAEEVYYCHYDSGCQLISQDEITSNIAYYKMSPDQDGGIYLLDYAEDIWYCHKDNTPACKLVSADITGGISVYHKFSDVSSDGGLYAINTAEEVWYCDEETSSCTYIGDVTTGVGAGRMDTDTDGGVYFIDNLEDVWYCHKDTGCSEISSNLISGVGAYRVAADDRGGFYVLADNEDVYYCNKDNNRCVFVSSDIDTNTNDERIKAILGGGIYVLDNSEDLWYCNEEYGCSEISQNEIQVGIYAGHDKMATDSQGGLYIIDDTEDVWYCTVLDGCRRIPEQVDANVGPGRIDSYSGRLEGESEPHVVISDCDSNTVVMIESDNQDNDVVFEDNSLSNHQINRYGDVHHSIDDSKIGQSSIYFDGSGDKLEITDSTYFNFGTDDLTVDMWLNYQSDPYPDRAIFQLEQDSSHWLGCWVHTTNGVRWLRCFMEYSGTKFDIGGCGDNPTHFDPYVNQWSHFAIVREGNSWYMFLNGEKCDQTGTFSDSFNPTKLEIGDTGSEGGWNPQADYLGYIDEFRVSKGVARWTDDFTPSTQHYCGETPYQNDCEDDNDCSAGEYCYKENCEDVDGECTLLIDSVDPNYNPVCGCDGETYDNTIHAMSVGVNIDYDGECITTCSGEDEFVRKGYTYTDFCTNDVLTEYYCLNSEPENETTICQNGCDDGACLRANYECAESDYGRNYYVFGTTAYFDGSATTIQNDFCIDEENLTEYYCNDSNQIDSVKYECPYGCDVDDGKCSQMDCAPTGEVVYFYPTDTRPIKCCDPNATIKPRLIYSEYNVDNGFYSCLGDIKHEVFKGECVLDWNETCGDGVCDDLYEDRCNCFEDCGGPLSPDFCLDDYEFVFNSNPFEGDINTTGTLLDYSGAYYQIFDQYNCHLNPSEYRLLNACPNGTYMAARYNKFNYTCFTEDQEPLPQGVSCIDPTIYTKTETATSFTCKMIPTNYVDPTEGFNYDNCGDSGALVLGGNLGEYNCVFLSDYVKGICADTDGANIGIKGTASVSMGGNTISIEEDECVSSNMYQVTERTCIFNYAWDDDEIKSTVYDCPTGNICDDGVCINPDAELFDFRIQGVQLTNAESIDLTNGVDDYNFEVYFCIDGSLSFDETNLDLTRNGFEYMPFAVYIINLTGDEQVRTITIDDSYNTLKNGECSMFSIDVEKEFFEYVDIIHPVMFEFDFFNDIVEMNELNNYAEYPNVQTCARDFELIYSPYLQCCNPSSSIKDLGYVGDEFTCQDSVGYGICVPGWGEQCGDGSCSYDVDDPQSYNSEDMCNCPEDCGGITCYTNDHCNDNDDCTRDECTYLIYNSYSGECENIEECDSVPPYVEIGDPEDQFETFAGKPEEYTFLVRDSDDQGQPTDNLECNYVFWNDTLATTSQVIDPDLNVEITKSLEITEIGEFSRNIQCTDYRGNVGTSDTYTITISACSNDQECGDDYGCDDEGICREECVTTDDCASGLKCIEGLCISSCGDGILDLWNNEQCDDENIINGDGCSEVCQIEQYCGNDVIEHPNGFNEYEQCDTSSMDGFTCANIADIIDGCSIESCNQTTCNSCEVQITYTDGTTCNDGALSSCELCDNSADPVFHVGGLTCADFGYSCTTPITTCNNCMPNLTICNSCNELCGNEFLEGTEECDDGNLLNDDGCNGTCELEYICGDGVTQVPNMFGFNEKCDLADLNGLDCTDFGFEIGTLTCANNCTYNTSNCSMDNCGNDVLGTNEECDDDLLGGRDCTDFNSFGSGNLFCNDDCTYDASSCIVLDHCINNVKDSDETDVDCGGSCNACDVGQNCTSYLDCASGVCSSGVCISNCGNNIIDGYEECDGTNLTGLTCTDFDEFTGGTLSCDGCKFDTHLCAGGINGICGDNYVNIDEVCDGTNLSDKDCTDFGFANGALTCLNCNFDISTCTDPICGDGIIRSTEQCDGTNLNGLDCTDFGYDGGILRCGACELDFTHCYRNHHCTTNNDCNDGYFCTIDSCINNECTFTTMDPCIIDDCTLMNPGMSLCNDGTCSYDCDETDDGINTTCNNDTICDADESCACADCEGEQSICRDGAICSNIIQTCVCEAGMSLCSDGTCSYDCDATDDGNDDTCINNGICDLNEGCSCADCEGEQSICGENAVCTDSETCGCLPGMSLCSDGTCSNNCILSDDGNDDTCNIDGTCDANESCACSDCDGEVSSCAGGSVCSIASESCECPLGQAELNGVCTSQTCTDSDVGFNYYNFGYTSVTVGDVNTPVITNDTCINSTDLMEQYCLGTEGAYTSKSCAFGCAEGACIKNETGCDNGIQDNDETDVDCGGNCQQACGPNEGCESDEDCIAGSCNLTTGTCWAPLTQVTYVLDAGWNLISLPIDPEDEDLETLFEDLLVRETLERVLNYDDGTWLAYNEDPNIPNNLDIIEKGKAYWVKMYDVDTLVVNGTFFTSVLDLDAEWNFIGVESLNSITAGDYFGAQTNSIDEIHHYVINATGDKNLELLGDGDVTDVLLAPGVGYWIYINQG